jgi:quinol monooxygenase YgiN
MFTPAGQVPASAPASAPSAASGGRPYGRLSIFTLLDDRAAEFDRLAEQAAEGVRLHEPDTLVYVMHVVPKAPMQRIIYEIFRDHASFEEHQRQPHIQQFEEGRKSCILVTNIIDLRLKYAKVAPMHGTVPASGAANASGRLPDLDGDWATERSPALGERSFAGTERRSQDWGPASSPGQRYRGN